jgi:hypothetical protein
VLYVDAFLAPQAQGQRGTIKAYGRLGFELETFDYRSKATQVGAAAMNAALVDLAAWWKPDIIHLGKCETVTGATVRELKEVAGALIFQVYGDYRPAPQDWVVEIGREADWLLMSNASRALWEKYRQAGVRNVGFWQMGTDPETFRPRAVQQTWDVVFTANKPPAKLLFLQPRVRAVQAVIDAGFDLHLFGDGWHDYADFANVTVHPFVRFDDFAEAVCRGRIVLGHSPEVEYYASWPRMFNTMACGAFLLARYFPRMEEAFINWEHLVWFHTDAELVRNIGYYLENETERRRIAANGRTLAVNRFTWERCIEDALEQMQWKG